MREDEQLRLCANEQTMEGCKLECVSVLHRRVGKNVCVSEENALWSLFPPNMRFNPLLECGCGHGLTVLPHSTPSHNCLN